MLLLLLLTAALYLFTPKDFIDSYVGSFVMYLILVKALLLGMGCDNVNFIQNSKIPNATCYIPYVQVINLSDSPATLTAYFITMLLPVVLMLGGTRPIFLNFFSYATVETYFNVLKIASLVSFVVWRIISFYIHSSLYDALGEAIEANSKTTKGTIGKIMDILVKASFLFPVVSMLGALNIHLETVRLKPLVIKRRQGSKA